MGSYLDHLYYCVLFNSFLLRISCKKNNKKVQNYMSSIYLTDCIKNFCEPVHNYLDCFLRKFSGVFDSVVQKIPTFPPNICRMLRTPNLVSSLIVNSLPSFKGFRSDQYLFLDLTLPYLPLF